MVPPLWSKKYENSPQKRVYSILVILGVMAHAVPIQHLVYEIDLITIKILNIYSDVLETIC